MNLGNVWNKILALATALLLWPPAAQAKPFGPVKSVSIEDAAFVLSGEESRVEIRFLGGAAARVDFFAPGVMSDFETYMTLPGALPSLAPVHDPAAREVSAPGIRVRYSMDPFSLTFLKPDGATLLRLKENGLEWSEDGAYSLTFEKEKGDRYYGLGEPMPGLIGEPISIDHRRKERLIWNAHVPPSNLPLPFVFNPRGCALLVENSWRAKFNFSGEGTFRYEAEGGPARFDAFAGGSHYDILRDYHRLTGATPIPPRWATGYLQSRYGYVNEADFRGLMDEFRGRSIPADALIFDLYWFGQGNMGNLWWTPKNFPNELEFQQELEDRGFKTITIVEPYIMSPSLNYLEVQARKLTALDRKKKPYRFPFWGREGVLLDFLNPETQSWFAEKVARIKRSGADGWWTDLNEPETDREDMFWGKGVPTKGAHNLQALLMHKAMAEMYAKEFPDERLFIMTRSGFVGDWRYGAGIWSGDVSATWNHLANQVPIAISASLSGYGSWNSDIGGFHGHPTPELFTRWMQFGAFNPVFRAHGNHDPREPWAYGEEAERNIKKIIELRYQLAPYHYNLLYELHESGKPPIRAMFLEFPDDPGAQEEFDQYMYGPDLLVAPVTAEGAVQRVVYLPKGGWYDFWTGKYLLGPKKVKAPAPLDRIPLFVREGSVLPMAPLTQFLGDKPYESLSLHIYPSPSGAAEGYVYEDDGKSNGYLKGESAVVPVAVADKDDGRLVTVGPSKGSYPEMKTVRDWEIVLHEAERPASVSIGGTAAEEIQRANDGSLPERDGWIYDEELKTVRVFAPNRPADFTIRIK